MNHGFHVNRDDKLHIIFGINAVIALGAIVGIMAVLMGIWP